MHKWKGNLLNLKKAAYAASISDKTSADYQDWYWLAWHATRKISTGQVGN